MKYLKDRQRVKVVVPQEEATRSAGHHLLNGKAGTVVRKRISDDGAWVEMDEPLPDSLRLFLPPDKRQDHVLLYPEECESAE
jgi:hypothetical protein